MANARIGYIRVSSLTQNIQRQLEGLSLDKIFTDHASGKDFNRPQLKECLNYIREGDKLFVHSMDRLVRNLSHLITLVHDLTTKGITIHFVKENLTFSGNDNYMSKFLLHVIGAVGELERSLIKERQLEGISIAKKQGKFKGRKRKLTDEMVEAIKMRIQNGEQRQTIAKEYGVSRIALYNYLRRCD